MYPNLPSMSGGIFLLEALSGNKTITRHGRTPPSEVSLPAEFAAQHSSPELDEGEFLKLGAGQLTE